MQYTAPLLQIVTLSRPSNGHFVMIGEGVPSSPINIQASPDLLTSFSTIGTTMTGTDGTFQYDDATAGTFSKRFYRAGYP